MAMKKTVVVEATLGEKFHAESRIGKHALLIDQPPEAGGDDTGPNPLQYSLLSLAGCISAIGRIVANQKKLPLRSMKITVRGEIDVAVLLGKSTENRAGFETVEVEVDVDADMSVEEKQAFLDEVDARCPVSDNMRGTTPVSVRLRS